MEVDPSPDSLTLEEARALLSEAAHLLQEAKPKQHTDRGLAMHWGRRRKALVNRVIELDVW